MNNPKQKITIPKILGLPYLEKCMHAMGWVLKIPHRLRDVCENVIMLKVLHHFKLFYRRFFYNLTLHGLYTACIRVNSEYRDQLFGA
jgi:hypothetical protein